MYVCVSIYMCIYKCIFLMCIYVYIIKKYTHPNDPSPFFLGLMGVRAERAATSARLGGGARAVRTSRKAATRKAP
jgi:hypothetical protein